MLRSNVDRSSSLLRSHRVRQNYWPAEATPDSPDNTRRYRALFEQNPAGLLVTDLHGRIRDCNASARAMFGVDCCATLVDREFVEFCPWCRDLEQAFHDLETDGPVFCGEASITREDGRELWISTSASLLRNAEGRPQEIYVTLLDVTEYKAAEQRIRNGERRFRALFERNMAGVFRTSFDGRLLEFNPALQRMFGFESYDDFAACNMRDFYVDPAQREQLLERLLQEAYVQNFELHVRRQDGSPIWLLSNCYLVRDAGGEPARIEGTVIDVTEQRCLQQQLFQAQKMEAIGQLAGGVAHDFNNLLTIIGSYAEMAGDLATDGRQRASIDQIIGATRRAATLTRELLAFSRKQNWTPQKIDISSAIADIEKILPRVIDKRICVEVRTAPNLPPVQTDPLHLEQVIMNLALNARDAMPEGGKLRLETSLCEINTTDAARQREVPAGTYVVLTVSDTGTGIDPKIRDRIFDPFFTTKKKGQGTGLGLSTVYGIVQQSAGHILVESEVGRGTTFRVMFPAVRPEQAEMREQAGRTDRPRAQGGGQHEAVNKFCATPVNLGAGARSGAA